MKILKAIPLLQSYLRNDLSNMTAEERTALKLLIEHAQVTQRFIKEVLK